MAYPRFQRARAFRGPYLRTAGSLTITSATWADLPTIGTTWDATLEAQVGDVLEPSISGMWNDEAYEGHLDVFSIVSAAPVNSYSGAATTAGAAAWWGRASNVFKVSGSILYVVQAGDIDANGQVTSRLRAKLNSAGSKTLIATTGLPLHFHIKNLGPADPE